MAYIRLDKYLADLQQGTRSQIKDRIRKGTVTVNGIVVKKPETKIDMQADEVCLDGHMLAYEKQEYYMLNKPQGVVSATVDSACRTVVDLIQGVKRKDLFPVGRLDKDTEGLLLITNDGELCHALLSPKKHVDKCYFAIVDGKITKADIEQFANRINIGTQEKAEYTRPAQLEVMSSYQGEYGELPEYIGADWQHKDAVLITIQEGKYHQVKRMFAAIHKPVLFLKRLRMGTLCLDGSLKPGEFRKLTKEEIAMLKKEDGNG